MSFNNINKNCPRENVSQEQGNVDRSRTKKILVLGITLLVVSIIVFLTGLGCLIGGIVSSTTLLIFVGIGLMSGGVLGILIAGLLIGLSKNKRIVQLENENKTLKDLIAKNHDIERAEKEILVQNTKREKAALQDNINWLEIEKTRLEGFLQRAYTDKEEIEKRYRLLESSFRDLETQSKELQERISLLNFEKDHLENRLEEILVENEQVTHRHQLLEGRFFGMENESRVIQEQMMHLEGENQELKTLIEHRHAAVIRKKAEVAATIQEKEKEIAVLNKDRQYLEREKEELQENLKFAQSEISVFLEENILLKQEVELHQGLVAITDERVSELEDQRMDLQEKIRSLEELFQQTALGVTIPPVETPDERVLKQAKIELQKTRRQEQCLRERVNNLRISIRALNTSYLEVLTRLRKAEEALNITNPEVVLARAQREMQREALITEKEQKVKKQESRLKEQDLLLIDKERVLNIRQQELDCKEDDLTVREQDLRNSVVIKSPRSSQLYMFLSPPQRNLGESSSGQSLGGISRTSSSSEQESTKAD